MISVQDLHWLEVACEAAVQSDCKMNVGTVLVKSGRALCITSNKMRNFFDSSVAGDTAEPLVSESDWTRHAEARALRSVTKKLKGATIYVGRVSKSGKLGIARPCENCAELLKMAGVSKVVYSTANGAIVERVRDL